MYTPDMKKKPIEMLIGMVNQANNFGFNPEDLEVLAPVVQEADTEGRDTKVDIDLTILPSEQEDDFVTFTYARIPLGELFGQINPGFREVDVPLNENGVPADADAFYAEILRKFGVNMDAENFEFSLKSAGVITVTAKPNNYAYIGSFDIAVVNSLASRIATTELQGFAMENVEANDQPAS